MLSAPIPNPVLARDRRVLDTCRRLGLPLSISMAGGYAPEVEDIVDIHFATVGAALDHWESATAAGRRVRACDHSSRAEAAPTSSIAS